MTRILFVCLGNICRSPAAEGVMRARAARRGACVDVASAGTGEWHIGRPPDPRMTAACAARGYDISRQRAQQVSLSHFYEFDHLLAMDRRNMEDLLQIAPPNRSCDIRLFLDYSAGDIRETPDPYYGDADGFGHVLDLVEKGVDAILDHLARERK